MYEFMWGDQICKGQKLKCQSTIFVFREIRCVLLTFGFVFNLQEKFFFWTKITIPSLTNYHFLCDGVYFFLLCGKKKMK